MKKTAIGLANRPFLFFLLFVLVAYLPVFLPFFHLKNDLVTQNLPTRFVISESLYSGYFPWWNPYINFGIPQFGDMNDGYWNPFLWLIARTVGYNIWSITLEEMFYVLVGGWGIYRLCRELGFAKATGLFTGMAYMTGGYVLGHLQHFCWITGTAFFPFVLIYFIRLQKTPTVKNLIAGGFAVFFFIASTHPGLVIGALYFLFFVLLATWLLGKDMLLSFWHPRFGRILLLWIGTGILLSIVVLVSNLDLLRHISRINRVALPDTLLNPTSLPSYISLLFPMAVQTQTFFDTDIAMRNTYIGVLGLAGFILFCQTFNRKLVLLTITGLAFFVLLSAGGWFKMLAWRFLPLLGHVRLNGEFTYFVLLILLLAGAAGIDRYWNRGPVRVFRVLQWICAGALALSVLMILFSHSSIIFASSSPGSYWKIRIKNILDHLSFWDLCLLQSAIQLMTLFWIGRSWPSRFKVVAGVALNAVLICWAVLPYTGLGMASKANRQALISPFPKGIQASEQRPLDSTLFIDASYARDLVLLGSYSKKIGYPKEEQYPVELTSTEEFFADKDLPTYIRRQSYLFLTKDTTVLSAGTCFDSSFIHIREFGPGRLSATVDNRGYKFLVFLQNDYPYWKVSVNGQPVTHFRVFRTFIAIPIPDGRQEVEFRFEPQPIKIALWLNILLAITGIALLCSGKIRNRSIA